MIIIITIIVVVVDDNAESGNSCLHNQSVKRKHVTCNPKMNYIHFSAIELGGGGGGGHSSVVRRGSEGAVGRLYFFLQTIF